VDYDADGNIEYTITAKPSGGDGAPTLGNLTLDQTGKFTLGDDEF
jgi:hypothetical protein